MIDSISDIYKELEKKHRDEIGTVVWDTEKGIYGPADCRMVYDFFKRVELDKSKHFLDLGSGDGRVVLIASLFTQATGIEYDEDLVQTSIKINDELGLRAEFKQKDFLEEDFTKYDFIFVNPDQEFSEELERKLREAVEKGSRLYVANHIFAPRKLKKGKIVWVNQFPFIAYEL